MRLIRILAFIFLITCIGFALGWFLKSEIRKDVWSPDTIRLYSDKKQVDITTIHDPQLFERILSLVVFELDDIISGGNVIALNEDILEMKKFAVEYIYNEPKIRKINNGDNKIETISFNAILFPVEEKWNGAVYLRTTDSKYLYCTSRPSLKFILDHI